MSAPSTTRLKPPAPDLPGRRGGRHWKIAGRSLAGIVAMVAVAAGGVIWYANTAGFKARVLQKLVGTIEMATGGRVELKSLEWRLFNLEVEVKDLTIHGLEGPGEIPYAHVDRLLVRARILSFLRPSIRLSLLHAEHPVFHLIVKADGSTNQPVPRKPPSSKRVSDSLLDLAVDRADLSQGLVLINQRAIPIDLAANAVGLQLHYLPGRFQYLPGIRRDDYYSATVTVTDLVARRGRQSPVHSKLDFSLDLHRDRVDLKQLRLQTGPTLLEASGSLSDYARPQWKLVVGGKVDMREVEALGGAEGLDHGIAEVQLRGTGSTTRQPSTEAENQRFIIDGKGRIEEGSYTAYSLNITGVNATATLHATESELRIENAIARLKRGGSVEGSLRIQNWLSSGTPTNLRLVRRPGSKTPQLKKVLKPVATIRARVTDISLQTVLQMTAPRSFRDIGFDTSATGDVTVDWTGAAADLTLEAKLNIAPPPQTDAGEAPVSGALVAKYFNQSGTVQISSLVAQTPATHLQVAGDLGVYPISQPSQLQGSLQTSNLGEFNKTLTDIGFTVNGRTGTKAIPIELHGQAAFQGIVTGTVTDPDVKGHLAVTAFEVVIPVSDTSAPPARLAVTNAPQAVFDIDRMVADGEYTSRLMSVQAATISHGSETAHLSGQLHAHQVGKSVWQFDERSSVDATLGIQKGSVAELLALAGESSIPATGTLNLDAHLAGSLDRMNGGGHLMVAGGQIYGEPYRSLNTDIILSRHEISLLKLSLLLDGGLQKGGALTGDGSYDLQSRMFHGTAQGRGFELAHLRQAQTLMRGAAVGGLFEFDATGQGTLQEPKLQGTARLTNLTLGAAALGDLHAEAHTEQHALRYTVDSNLNLAKLHLSGQTEVTGLHETSAQLSFSQLDIEPLLRLAKVEGLTGRSSIAGTVRVSGPLSQPESMSGEAELSEFAVNVASVALKSEGRVHATLRAGTLHLDPLHITGDETNLTAQGSIAVLGHHDLNLHAEGGVNVRLAGSINPDITSSGHVDFGVDASGNFAQPSLAGQVRFVNVAMALQDLPNGLSQMNGTLQFNQDRLEVKDLTASTGGGQLRLGGYITYQRGLYGDISATGKGIRVRYPQGVSSVADASLHLQGQPANMLLSGNIVVTRFAISPDLDIAGLSGSTSQVFAPPADDAPSNHVRLDVSIASAPQLNFQNSLAKLAGDVDLHVRGTVANPSVLGRVNITDGSATFAGTHYQLQRGDIYFTNPVRIEPNIDVSATARVEEYDINIGVHGTPSSLSVSYRSEPPLPQADVIALLAIGRTQEEQQIYSQQQSGGVNPGTDALLSGALNATLSNRVQRLFGGGSVKIDPSFVGTLGTSTARITVEQQVAKNVLITYATNVNTTAQQLIQAQVDLTRNVSVVAVRDESGVFSMVLKVHKRIR